MNFFDMNSEVCNLRAEEERILSSFTRRLIEIAAVAAARGSDTSPAAALNAMRLPAIALDQDGFVAEVNAAAETIFDNDVKIKDRRLFVRDPAARALIKEVIDQLRTSPRLNPLATDPIIVQRQDKMPVIVRIWPFDWAARLPMQEVRALLTLNALGPKPGPPAAILAKTFRLTPSEAKLACVIARGASLNRGWRIEDFTGDGAQSVEIGLCQDRHTSPKRTCRAAFAGRMTDGRASGRRSEKVDRLFRSEHAPTL